MVDPQSFVDARTKEALRSKARYNADPDAWLRKNRAWEKANPEKKKLYDARWWRKNHPRPACQWAGCSAVMETGQRKFCRVHAVENSFINGGTPWYWPEAIQLRRQDRSRIMAARRRRKKKRESINLRRP